MKQSDNRAYKHGEKSQVEKCEESPCIQGQAAGESPDDASRWKVPQERERQPV